MLPGAVAGLQRPGPIVASGTAIHKLRSIPLEGVQVVEPAGHGKEPGQAASGLARHLLRSGVGRLLKADPGASVKFHGLSITGPR